MSFDPQQPQPVDPTGRMDVAAVRIVEHVVRGRNRGNEVWDRGLGALVELAVKKIGIPTEPITVQTIAKTLGLLPAEPKKRK